MRMDEIQRLFDNMEAEQAASWIATIMKKLWPVLSEDVRIKFVMSLVGESGQDKVASLVHLGLAECMDEGVDPTRMCQSLVDKIAQSKQLSSVAHPEVLVLFENWLEELESELIRVVKKTGERDPVDVAEATGLSRSGAKFLITKLQREAKL